MRSASEILQDAPRMASRRAPVDLPVAQGPAPPGVGTRGALSRRGSRHGAAGRAAPQAGMGLLSPASPPRAAGEARLQPPGETQAAPQPHTHPRACTRLTWERPRAWRLRSNLRGERGTEERGGRCDRCLRERFSGAPAPPEVQASSSASGFWPRAPAAPCPGAAEHRARGTCSHAERPEGRCTHVEPEGGARGHVILGAAASASLAAPQPRVLRAAPGPGAEAPL